MMIQLSQSPSEYKEKILELIWGNVIEGQTFHLVHGSAYRVPEYKQSCLGFLAFESLQTSIDH